MAIEGLSVAAVGIAFAGGVVSFVSPCVLPLVPIYLGHLSGASVQGGRIQGGRATFMHAVSFAIGFSAVFVALGATVGVLGGTAGGQQSKLAKAADVLLIIFGLYMAGFFKLPGLRTVTAPVTGAIDRIFYRERRYQGELGDRPSYWRSIGVGAAFAVGWTPCITPVLGAILTLAFNNAGDTLGAWSAAGQAALLLTFYAAGLSLPFLVSGLMVGRVTPLFKRVNRLLPAITVASGVLMVAVGVLVFQNLVIRLNQYFSFLPYVSL